jgi:hypothetical protein
MKTFEDWLDVEQNTPVSEKVRYFEYFVSKLVSDPGFDPENNNYSSQKMMLLLFFLCNSDVSLFDLFDNWHALPYGHVEADLYDYIKKNKGEFSFFVLDRFKLTLKE